MKVSNSSIKFRIDIDFEDSDVDMVYNEMRSRGVTTPFTLAVIAEEYFKRASGKPVKSFLPIDESKLDKTPTEASVDFCLNWLAGFVDRNEMCVVNSKWTDYSKPRPEGSLRWETKTELEELGIDVTDWYGLMQGTCHLNCEVHTENFSPELVEKANLIVKEVFANLIVYYNSKSLQAG